MIHTQKYIYMFKFYRLQGLQGYLLCIVRLQQVTKIFHKQRNKAMSKFYRLHTRVTRLLAVHCEATIGYRGNRHSRANNKVMSKFIGYNATSFLAVYCEVTTGYRDNRHKGYIYDTLCSSTICFSITFMDLPTVTILNFGLHLKILLSL